MGSITSRPKVPQVSQPVYYVPAPVSYNSFSSSGSAAMPAPAATTSAEAAAPAGESGNGSAEPSAPEIQSEAREGNLLSRRRGRLSTIATSFRGILSDTVSPGSRKSLLGE